MMVEMGLDRLHHVFWHYCDPNHPKYEPGNKYENAFRDYYRMLDREVGELLEVLPPDAVRILMSDHGARAMVGGVCFNDWLVHEGTWRCRSHSPAGRPSPRPHRLVPDDGLGRWGLLRAPVPQREGAGAAGHRGAVEVRGGSGRAGRQARGHARTGRLGPRHPGHQAPGRVPRGAGVAPDLIVYFGDLEWRSVGAMGMGEDGGFHAPRRHRARWRQPRPHRGVRHERPARPAHREARRHEPDRRGPHADEAVRAPEPEGVQGRSIV